MKNIVDYLKVFKNIETYKSPGPRNMADGGRIGFDPGGTVKKATGPTKKNVGNTSPVKKGKFKYPRKNKYGTVWSDTPAGGSRRNLIEMRGIGNEIIEKFKKGWSSVQLEDLYGLDNDTILDYIKLKQPRLKVAKADKRRLNQWKYDKSVEPKIAKDAKNMSRRQILEKWGNKISKKKLDSLVKEGKITFGIVEEAGRPRILEGEKSEKVKKRQRRIWNVQRGEFSGTFAKNFHHIYPIGGMADFSPQDTMILDKKFNEILGGDNLRLNDIADEIADIDFSQKGALKKLDDLNAESKMIVDRAKAKLPKELKNAIGFIRYEPIFDEYGTVINFNQIREGVDDTSGSLGKFSKKKFKDFNPAERTSFRKFVKEEALQKFKDAGIPCLKGLGGQCNSIADYQKGFNQLVKEAADGKGSAEAIKKLGNFTKSMRAITGAAKWTGYGLLAEAGFMVPFAIGDYAAGESWKRILGNATDYGFGPIFGQSEQEEFEAALPEGSAAPQRRKVYELGERLDRLEQQPFMPQGRIGMDKARREKSAQNVYEGILDEYILNMQPFLRTSPHLEESRYYDQYLMNKAEQEDIATMKKLEEERQARIDERTERGIIANKNWQSQVPYAGGGMVGIRKPSAIPPESGPMSQGLRSLYNNGRKL